MGSRPLKILRLITRLNIGGPAIHAVTLSAWLPAGRFSTTLACGQVGPGEGDMVYFAEAHGVRPIVIPWLRRRLNPFLDALSLGEILRIMRRERPDIVHTHMSKAGALGRLAARLFPRVKTVHTFHGNVLAEYFSPTLSRAFVLTERRLARFTDRLVVLGESQRLEMLRRFRVGVPGQYRIIPLGFDLTGFAGCGALRGSLRAELGIPLHAPVVSIVGRLAPVKDHSLFIAAACRVRDEFPEAVFLIAGDGELRGMLEAEAGRAGMGRCTRFLGWRRDLPRVYADSDVVVLTSRNEGTPVSLIEAAAAGRPVVATDVGGVRDVVRDGESGLLARGRGPDEIAGLVCGLLRDPAFGKRLGEEGRRAALSRYGKERLIADIAGLYEELADG